MAKVDLDEVQETFLDIVSSGTGGEIGDCHVKELKKLLKPLTKQQKTKLWERLKLLIDGSEGWYLEDIKLVKKLLVGTELHWD